MNWYLIQTKHNSHLMALKHLQKQGFEIFLPLTKKTSKKMGKFVNKTIPLFPNYLFIGSRSGLISWRSINATRGVSKAVTLDGSYHAIHPDIISSLKSKCSSTGIFKFEEAINIGDKAKIEQGPFVDLICQVENVAENQRVWVLIDIMQQKIRAEVSSGDISNVF